MMATLLCTVLCALSSSHGKLLALVYRISSSSIEVRTVSARPACSRALLIEDSLVWSFAAVSPDVRRGMPPFSGPSVAVQWQPMTARGRAACGGARKVCHLEPLGHVSAMTGSDTFASLCPERRLGAFDSSDRLHTAGVPPKASAGAPSGRCLWRVVRQARVRANCCRLVTDRASANDRAVRVSSKQAFFVKVGS